MSLQGIVQGIVQRIDAPRPDTVVLSLYRREGDEASTRVLVTTPRGVFHAQTRPRGAPADAFVQRLRKLLGRARVFVERRGNQWRLRFETRDQSARLTYESGSPVLRDSEGRPLAGRRRFPAAAVDDANWEPADPAEYVAGEEDPRQAIDARIRAELKRVRRTISKVEADVARAARAPAIRHEAELILSHLHAYEPGAAHLDVQDWEADPPARRLAIDPRVGARALAQGLYHRAGRFERSVLHGERRREELDARAALLENLLADRALDADEVEGRAQLRRRPQGARQGAAPRRAYRHFETDDGPIFVGRGAADNDTLTLRVARPHDLWLHARNLRGAHVVVPLDRGADCSPRRIADAAMLAAHFSEAKDDAIVDVLYTDRRHVRKPRGSAPGSVRVERDKTIAVRMDRERLRWLITRER